MSSPHSPVSDQHNQESKLEGAREKITDTMNSAQENMGRMARNITGKFRERTEKFGRQNVADPERLGSLVLGGLVAAMGVRRGGVTGWLAAAGGLGLLYRGATGHCPMYQSLGINTAGPHARGASLVGNDAVCVEKTVLVNKPREELYRHWRNLENLPGIMRHLDSVTVRDGKHSHWVAKGPAGSQMEWDAEIINEHENELIAWRSLEDADVPNAGSVRFTDDPLGRGTWIKVSLMYQPPAGRVGSAVAKLFGEEPHLQIDDDLRRFKQFMETGEVATIEGQPRGE